ncbi:NAD(P)-binding protein [Daldinia decipiens]|uniref:NAD(P)-binding protein n=1 Tax=Daldinia decipiens TaxID=326647 RepID=UPI0020C473A8|nr:NAD(P)-binding protein [Daldinia decipiens]KAI1653131.1 NAD(P)-binding protein [Daldinia decipiens]
MSSSLWTLLQQFYPPAPTVTEKNLAAGSQVGKVFIVTGANSGIGLDLVKFLYPTGATIYLASRSLEKIDNAIAQVSAISPAPATPATLKSLYLDLSDLTTIKPAAASFAAQESRLDILWHNAGFGYEPGSVTKQGLEAHIGTHCVAPLLFTQELLPQLQAAAKSAPKDSVRIVWTGSIRIDINSPPGGVDFARIEKPTINKECEYGASKAGNYFLAAEGARRWGKYGIISVCQNPGNLYTPIWGNSSWWHIAFFRIFVLYPSKYGAYTMLYAGFSPDVNEGTNGAYIWPWGRIRPVGRSDVLQAVSDGKAAEFWEWCEKKWGQYV